MRGTGDRVVWFAVLAVVGLVAGTAGASASYLEGVVTVPGDVALDGSVDTTARPGVLNIHAGMGTVDATLTADAIKVHLEYEEGYRATGPDGETPYWHRMDGGSGSVNLTSVTASFAALGPGDKNQQVLAIADQGTADLRTAGSGQADAGVVQERWLAKHWHNSTANEGIEPVGFRYQLQGPWAGVTRADAGVAEGDFTLFVNNVTLNASADQGSWKTWAGTQTRPVDSPAGPADPAPAREYEVRVVVIEVTNGTLTVDAPGEVELYGPELDAEVSGNVTAEAVSGRLASSSSVFRFTQASLDLQGVGTLGVRAVPAGGLVEGSPDRVDAARLSLSPRGAFAVDVGEGVEVHEVETGSSVLAWLPSGPWLGVWGTLLALGVLGTVVVVGAPTRVRTWVDARVVAWRRERFERWLMRAEANEELHEFERAARWWRKIVHAYPERLHGWYQLALAHVELGQRGKALEVLARARTRFGSPLPTDFWELWIDIALASGEHPDAAVEAFLAWADQQPEHACRSVMKEPRLAALLEDERVRAVFDREGIDADGDADLRGYA